MTAQPAETVSTSVHRVPSMLRALQRILSPGGFPYASGYHLFKDAYFGRDSLEVAEDLLEMRPDIARAVIVQLAALQGTGVDVITEEEPGKIHHEYRALVMHGRPVDEDSRALFRRLAEHWQLAATEEELDALTELINYGSVDATPLYVRLVYRYCRQVGAEVLEAEYSPRGRIKSETLPTIRDSVRRAVDWIVRGLERSELGLLEFQRMTPRGHRFQAWKDGTTSYLHTDASFANYNAPIASIEVQGLTYDALVAASVLLPDAPEVTRARWAELATRLQETVMRLFWMPDRRYFAMALDRDPRSGEVRQVQTMTSNPGALLDSGIFDSMEPGERQRYISAIVTRLYSGEFVTPVGVRCSSLLHKHLLDYMAYQSSHTVWHKETYDIARGLRRQGFLQLAEDLEVRLLNAINLVGGATEFLYVLPDGRADCDPFRRRGKPPTEEILGTNVPENDQAWSISAALAVKWRRGRRQVHQPVGDSWQHELEREKSREIQPAPLLRTEREIARARQEACGFSLNMDEGWRRETAYVRSHDLPMTRQ